MTGKDVLTQGLNFFIGKRIALPGLLLLALSLTAMSAHASQPSPPSLGEPVRNYTSIAAAPNGGFWVQLDHKDGVFGDWSYKTIAVDGAPEFLSVGEAGSIAAIPSKNGYWVVTTEGKIHARGEAPELCAGQLKNCSGYVEGWVITAAAASPRGNGLWAVDDFGHVWTAGNVASYGDAVGANGKPSGMAATPSGFGYYIVNTDGGVHARGDAVFFGSTGGNKPGGREITGIALSYDLLGKVNGYWLVGSDGGVHSFGNAPFLGSTGGAPGGHQVSSIVARPDGRSYAWVYRDGKVEKSSDPPPVVIKSVTEGKVIEVPNNSMEPETQLKLAAANGSTSQKWNLTKHGDAFKIVNVNSGLCMDLEYGAESGRVIQYPCKDDQNPTNQLWKPVNDLSGGMQFYALEQPDYRLYGYPENLGSGLIVSYYVNNGLSWRASPVLD